MGFFAQVKELLKREGWIKGVRYDEETGKRCLLGGVDYLQFGANTYMVDENDTILKPLVDCIKQTELFQSSEARRDSYNCNEKWNDKHNDYSKIVAGFNNDPDVTMENIEQVLDCAEEASV